MYLYMDEEFYLQDVVWCNVCDLFDLKCCCDKCNVRLCVLCVEKYFKDDLIEYYIIIRK